MASTIILSNFKLITMRRLVRAHYPDMRYPVLSVMAILITGCEGPRPLVYNMTSCPVTIIYSVANIHDNRQVVAPGEGVGSTGPFHPWLKDAVIVDASGMERDYHAERLARMRGSGTELWGYYSDGLHFMKSKPGPDTGSLEVAKESLEVIKDCP